MRVLLTLALSCGLLPAQSGYLKPPQAILDVLNAPVSPSAITNPSHTHVLLARNRRNPPISELAQPVHRIAGLRINPRNSGLHVPPAIIELSLLKIDDGKTVTVTLPKDARLSTPKWSPDGKLYAVANTRETAIELWIGDLSGSLRQVNGVKVNAAYGETVQWMPDSRHLLVQTVPASRGPAPQASVVPDGPRIQESMGSSSPVWTFQDLLTSKHDEDLFEHFATSQLMMVDTQSSKATAFGDKGLYLRMDPSPDGKLILYTKTNRPYSWLHTYTMFPQQIGVLDRSGKVLKAIYSQPLADKIPIEGVPTGPRGISWRPDESSTLYWSEALDDGDPKKKVSHRDKLMTWKAPFDGQAAEWTRTEQRFMSVDWGKGFALVRDYDRSRRWVRTIQMNTTDSGVAPKIVFDMSMQERYRNPGSAVEHTTANGQRMLLQDGDDIFFSGPGATPQGQRPFLIRHNIKTGERKEVFRAGLDRLEKVIEVLSHDGSRILTSRESNSEPPNYFLRTGDSTKALTSFQDPVPQLRKIKKQIVKYKRPDGVDLSFTLYLPPDYKEGTRLPTVVWAYPREFTDANVAGQFGGTNQQFTSITGTSHLFYLLAGYAVLDDAAMPVVGDPVTVNNTYVEQIVASAKAAIDKAAEMGVTDPTRVGVGGHSYGAFMTANLLAHSDLFRAGVARSGAYNRTLTPFGFQSERRTLWEASDIYLRMSPFMVANKIKEPLLLIHGEADNNAGTFPVQSDRMYQAVRGNGGNVRLVFLPYESHGYLGRESIEHTLAEMINWFDKFVKNAGPAGAPSSAAVE